MMGGDDYDPKPSKQAINERAYVQRGLVGTRLPSTIGSDRSAPTLPAIVNNAGVVQDRLRQVHARLARVNAALGHFHATKDIEDGMQQNAPSESLMHTIVRQLDSQSATLDRIDSAITALESIIGV